MASLTRSVETSLPHSETEMKDNICQLEEEIRNYCGGDPLEPWVRLINYLEQTCLPSGKFTHQYTVILGRCIRTFVALPRPPHLNDIRFVDILIKSCNGSQPERRIVVLKSALRKGVGAKVSRMYIAIAENHEKLQEFKPALEQLRQGIAESAQPLLPLEAALIDLEYRVSETVSKSMEASKNDQSMVSGLMSFGGSFDFAPTNEAPSFRIAPSFTCPTNSRPRNDLRSVPIFQSDAEIIGPPETLAPLNAFKEIEMMQNEKGNQLEPTVCNERNNVMLSEAPARSAAPYVGTDATIGAAINQETLQRPSISEIKIPDLPGINKSTTNTLLVTQVEPSAVTNIQELTQIPKVSEIVTSESLDKDALCKTLPVLLPPAPTNTPVVQLPPPAPPTIIRIVCRTDQLWKNGREVTFEQLRAIEYQNRRHSSIRKTDATNVTPGSEIDRKNQQIEDLERKIDEFSKEKAGLLDEISRLKDEHILEVERRVTQTKNECIEAFHADQIQSSRDKSELLNVLRSEKLRRLNSEDEVERLKQQLSGLQTVVQKLKHTTEFELFTDATLIVASENTLACDESDYDDTEVVLKRNESAVDFDVTNLTRALNFCPKPLLNSTPEKGNSDSSKVMENSYSLRMPEITPRNYGGPSGQFTASPNNVRYQHPRFNQTTPPNLSTIQEASRENQSSCTNSSGLSNKSTVSTFCAKGNFRSPSRHQ